MFSFRPRGYNWRLTLSLAIFSAHARGVSKLALKPEIMKVYVRYRYGEKLLAF